MRAQRWRERRQAWAERETINPLRFEVAEICGAGSDTIARAFVETHHYSGTYASSRARYGLYEAGRLVGVAQYSHPVRECVLDVAPGLRADADLGRFVLLDGVPVNGESWFLGRCIELLRRDHGWRAFVSKSDPMPRSTADGVIVTPGHVGTIYQATNAAYYGTTRPEWEHLLPDATAFHGRAVAKVLAAERGWRPWVDKLVGMGAVPLPEDAPAAARAAWVDHVKATLCRRVKNPGKHSYAFGLDRHAKRAIEDEAKRRATARRHGWHPPLVPRALPYPKRDAA